VILKGYCIDSVFRSGWSGSSSNTNRWLTNTRSFLWHLKLSALSIQRVPLFSFNMVDASQLRQAALHNWTTVDSWMWYILFKRLNVHIEQLQDRLLIQTSRSPLSRTSCHEWLSSLSDHPPRWFELTPRGGGVCILDASISIVSLMLDGGSDCGNAETTNGVDHRPIRGFPVSDWATYEHEHWPGGYILHIDRHTVCTVRSVRLPNKIPIDTSRSHRTGWDRVQLEMSRVGQWGQPTLY